MALRDYLAMRAPITNIRNEEATILDPIEGQVVGGPAAPPVEMAPPPAAPPSGPSGPSGPVFPSYPISQYGGPGSVIPQAGGGPPQFEMPDPFVGPQFDFNPADLTQDPSYQFRLEQGRKALEASAAAKGTLHTGGTLRDLIDYGQNYASQEFGNVWNRAMKEYETDYRKAFDEYATGYQGAQDLYQSQYDPWAFLSGMDYNAWNAYLQATLQQQGLFNQATDIALGAGGGG